jgi:hypothetical protein
MVGGQQLQISVPEGFLWYEQQKEGGRYRAKKNTLRQYFFPFFPNRWLQFVSQHITISHTCYFGPVS